MTLRYLLQGGRWCQDEYNKLHQVPEKRTLVPDTGYLEGHERISGTGYSTILINCSFGSDKVPDSSFQPWPPTGHRQYGHEEYRSQYYPKQLIRVHPPPPENFRKDTIFFISSRFLGELISRGTRGKLKTTRRQRRRRTLSGLCSRKESGGRTRGEVQYQFLLRRFSHLFNATISYTAFNHRVSSNILTVYV